MIEEFEDRETVKEKLRKKREQKLKNKKKKRRHALTLH